MSFKRKIKRGDRIYYDEVESVMVNGKVVQKHLRCIGTNPDKPTSFPIDNLHFGCIAMRLMQSDLSSNEILDMIEKVWYRVLRDDLEVCGIWYRFKKRYYSLPPFNAPGNRGGTKMQRMQEKTEECEDQGKEDQNPPKGNTPPVRTEKMPLSRDR